MKLAKQLLTFLILNSVIQIAFSQAGEWTWESGDSTVNNNGIYGMRESAGPGNMPGSRELAQSWTDHTGNLWLYGGVGFAASGSAGGLNDLWKYDVTNNEWTWVSGNNDLYEPTIYGTRGIADSSNSPGSREYGVTWTDNNGNLWLFGGIPVNGPLINQYYLNDLWEYNIRANEWTWISGDTMVNLNGVYGTKGTPALENVPGGRYGATGWADNAGNLWLFAGLGYPGSGTATGYLNDLWKFNIANNEWIWENGDSIMTYSAIYGTMGVPDTGNKPGARVDPLGLTDHAGNFWLFGGGGNGANGKSGLLNDLWEYTAGNNLWTWIADGDTVNASGIYGTAGLSAPVNLPGGRARMVGWMDQTDNIWVLGGNDYDAQGNNGLTNDLWEYHTGSQQWEWVTGDSIVSHHGIYGMECLAAPANTPGARENAVSWTDNSGNFWMFAGYGYAASTVQNLNDLWKFNSGNSVLPPVARFSALADTVCAGSMVTFTDSSTGSPVSWHWSFTGGTPDTSATQNPTITYNTAGTYPVELLVSNTGGSDSLIKSSYIIVRPVPVPVVTVADTIFCSGDSVPVCTGDTFVAYKWNTGDTSFCTTAKAAGDYYLTVTAANGCSSVSGQVGISVYPVPSVSIAMQGDTLSSFGQMSYQWYLNSDSISLATNPVYVARQAGSYTVAVADSNGCTAVSSAVLVTSVEEVAKERVLLYPNPTMDNWQLTVDNSLLRSTIEGYDDQGRTVFKSEIQNLQSEIALDVPVGIYYLRISNNNVSVVRKLVKM